MVALERRGWSRQVKMAGLVVFVLALLTALGGCAWIQNWFNPTPPTVLKEISEKEAEAILDTQVSGLRTYKRLKEQEEPDALGNTVSWLKTQPEVSDSCVTPDGNISILYTCGLIGTLLIHTPTTLSVGSPISSTVYSVPKTLGPRENLLSLKTTLDASPGNKKAIILLPFQQQGLELPEGVNKLINDLQSAGYSIDGPFVNGEVTLDRMKTLNQYGTIYIITHGGLAIDLSLHPRFNQVEIATGQEAHPSLLRGMWNDLVYGTFTPGGIGISTVSGVSYFCIFGSFIDDMSYPSSLVVINACSSFANDSLANAFLNSGAAAYFGWTSTTSTYFIDQVTKAMFDLAVKPNCGVIEAYNTPYRFHDWGTYSINQLYPGTYYKDKNNNGRVTICYSNEKCRGDLGDTDAEKDFETDFNYKLRRGLVDLVLNPVSNQPPTASIAAPTNGSTFNEGTPITFQGSATDPEDGALAGSSLVWTSSVNGQIGIGESLTTNTLSVGTHTVTLTATDSDGNSASASINIVVSSIGPPPPSPGPSTGKIAFVSGRNPQGGIYLMNPDGSSVQRLSYGGQDPAWSLDDTKLAFTTAGTRTLGSIVLMNSDGSNVRKLVDEVHGIQGIAWSPNGAKIAFASSPSQLGSPEIYVMNADGTNLHNITNYWAEDVSPTWSPDGTRIAFESYRDGEYDIYVMDADGGNVQRLTFAPYSPRAAREPAWSPNGDKIAFSIGFDIYVMDADGSSPQQLTNTGTDNSPTWSPDGTRIAFVSWRDGNQEIYVMNADGSNQHNVTNNPAEDWDPAWSRDAPRQ